MAPYSGADLVTSSNAKELLARVAHIVQVHSVSFLLTVACPRKGATRVSTHAPLKPHADDSEVAKD